MEVPGAGKVLFSTFSTGLTDPIALDCELRKNGLSEVTIFGSGLLKRRTGSNGVGQRVLTAGLGEYLWRCASVSTGVTVFVDPADLDSLRDKVSRRPSPKTAELCCQRTIQTCRTLLSSGDSADGRVTLQL